MTIPEAAQLVIQAAGMADGGEVFVLDMGEPVRIWDLAHSMVRLAGLTVQENGNEGDLSIIETGLRPGEKLYEELLIGDNALPTGHERIMRAREDFVKYGPLMLAIERLDAAITRNDAVGCRTLLAELVPTLATPKPGANRTANGISE